LGQLQTGTKLKHVVAKAKGLAAGGADSGDRGASAAKPLSMQEEMAAKLKKRASPSLMGAAEPGRTQAEKPAALAPATSAVGGGLSNALAALAANQHKGLTPRRRSSVSSMGTAPPSRRGSSLPTVSEVKHTHDDWEETHDDSGQVYYHNTKTGESAWTRPGADDTWEKTQDEAGRAYYHNRATGETAWDEPASSRTTVATPQPEAAAPTKSQDSTSSPPTVGVLATFAFVLTACLWCGLEEEEIDLWPSVRRLPEQATRENALETGRSEFFVVVSRSSYAT
jgi:hypothetical protein